MGWMPRLRVKGWMPSLRVHGVDVPTAGSTDEEEGGALVAAMCKCHQCTRDVAAADCTITDKSRVSKKVAPIYRCKWCNRLNVVLYKEMLVDSQLKSLHQAMSSTDKKEWLALHHQEFENVVTTSDILKQLFGEVCEPEGYSRLLRLGGEQLQH